MSGRPTIRRRLKTVGAFLAFLGRQPDCTLKGEEKIAWKQEVGSRLASLTDDALIRFGEIWRKRYDELEATRVSASTRANSLFVFVGVLTTGATIVSGSLVRAPLPLLIVIWIAAGLLVYSALGAAVLAVRSQLVTNWDIPRVDLNDTADERTLVLTNAVEVYIAAEQNKRRLANVTGCLRDGQIYALVALFVVATLVVLSVVASAARPPEVAGPDAGSPWPGQNSVVRPRSAERGAWVHIGTGDRQIGCP